MKELRKSFEKVLIRKPAASRAQSRRGLHRSEGLRASEMKKAPVVHVPVR